MQLDYDDSRYVPGPLFDRVFLRDNEIDLASLPDQPEITEVGGRTIAGPEPNLIPYLVLILWGSDAWGSLGTIGLLFVRMDRYRRGRLADWADSLRFLRRMLPEPEEINKLVFNCPATMVFTSPRYDDPTAEITFEDMVDIGAIFTAAGQVGGMQDLAQQVDTAASLTLRADVSPEVAQLLEERQFTWEVDTKLAFRPLIEDKPRIEDETSFLWSTLEDEEGAKRLESPRITEARVQEFFGEHPATERGVTRWGVSGRTIGRVSYPDERPGFKGPDIIVSGAGSLYMLKPVSDAGRKWMDNNLQPESWQWIGGALGVEHRFVVDILDGMQEDGLIIQVDEVVR